MKFGFILPGGPALEQVQQAELADRHGWDGVFVWEAAYGVDAWTLLAAMAQRTRRVRLGTMLTPLPWRRPWKVASQVITLDQLSGGRAILAVGLGAVDTALGDTGEQLDRRIRADMLDEGIAIISGLQQGNLAFEGRHYHLDLAARADLAEVGRPVQQPRVPIWVVGAWPRPKSMRRALTCDGVLPVAMDASGFRQTAPADIVAMRTWLAERGGTAGGFDVVMEGETPAADQKQAVDIVRPWAEAGCTWWLESRWELTQPAGERMRQVTERIMAGPPRLT